MRRLNVSATLEKQRVRTAAAPAAPRTRSPRPATKQLVQSFTQHWLPRLLQQQEELHETYTRVSSFGERLAAEVNRYQARLSQLADSVTAAFAPGSEQQKLLPGSRPPKLDAGLLELPRNGNGRGAPSDGAATGELSSIVAGIQATNQQLRELDGMYGDVDHSLLVLQEGAEQRDQQTAAYRDALLALADDLEQAEAEERARAAEAARQAAEEARLAAEAKQLEEEAREAAMRAELEDLVSAASAAQQAAPIKVEVGVRMATKPGQDVVLVGSHPSLGSWSLDGALPMTWSEGHVWKASIELPPDASALEYKAVLRGGGKAVWEKGDNHRAELQGSSDVSLFHVFQA